MQALASVKLTDDPSLLDPAPLEAFLEYAVNPQQLRAGIELWVAAFPSIHNPLRVYNPSTLVKDGLRAKFLPTVDYFHIQATKTDEELYQTLLASAAIPGAFVTRKVEGKHYVDGFLGDNVPLKALSERGCTHAIVVHLDNGELWSRHNFPNQTIIEIRPTEDIGGFTKLLDLSPDRVKLLRERGYQDAKRCLEPILQTLAIEQSRQVSLGRL